MWYHSSESGYLLRRVPDSGESGYSRLGELSYDPTSSLRDACLIDLFMTTLDTLAVGQSANITEIQGNDAIAIRLMEMGLTEGEEIRVLAVAPLGDPVEYEIRGYRLSLRRTEARRVLIQSPGPA